VKLPQKKRGTQKGGGGKVFTLLSAESEHMVIVAHLGGEGGGGVRKTRGQRRKYGNVLGKITTRKCKGRRVAGNGIFCRAGRTRT